MSHRCSKASWTDRRSFWSTHKSCCSKSFAWSLMAPQTGASNCRENAHDVIGIKPSEWIYDVVQLLYLRATRRCRWRIWGIHPCPRRAAYRTTICAAVPPHSIYRRAYREVDSKPFLGWCKNYRPIDLHDQQKIYIWNKTYIWRNTMKKYLLSHLRRGRASRIRNLPTLQAQSFLYSKAKYCEAVNLCGLCRDHGSNEEPPILGGNNGCKVLKNSRQAARFETSHFCILYLATASL